MTTGVLVCTVVLLLAACLVAIQQAAFIHEPNAETMYFVPQGVPGYARLEALKERTFNCKTQLPVVRYHWLKDGKEFDLGQYSDRVTFIPGEGTFAFSKFELDDEGVYQCVVETDYGTAVDKPIHFKSTRIAKFNTTEPEQVDVQLGDPFSRRCVPPNSVPPPTVYWILMGTPQQRQFRVINSSHISSDDEGTIFFHYVTASDYNPSYYYTCVAQNDVLDEYKFGNQFQLSVNHNLRRTLSIVPPLEQYVSPQQVTGVRGKDTTLYCFYSGFPQPTPVWLKNGNRIGQKELVSGQYDLRYAGALKLNSITDEHRGNYSCEFETNSLLNREITVDVQGAPYWVTNPPASVNATEGSTVEFICDATGSPNLNFTFYKNGNAIRTVEGVREIPGNHLILKGIRKRENGWGDDAIYQCKVQNEYGSIWANFYLNI